MSEHREDVKLSGTESVAGNSPNGTASDTESSRTWSPEEEAALTSAEISNGRAATVTASATTPDRNGQDAAHRLANLLQALDDCDADFAEDRLLYKSRRENLVKQIGTLRFQIISGQAELPLEPAA